MAEADILKIGLCIIALELAILIPRIIKFWKKLLTPSITIEDVKQCVIEDRKRLVDEIERIVNVAISRQLAGLAVGQEGK